MRCACAVSFLLLSAAVPGVQAAAAADSTPVYQTLQVSIPVTGDCDSTALRLTSVLNRTLTDGGVSPVSKPQCTAFGGDPDAWLVFEVLAVDEKRAAPVIASALRNFGVDPRSEISYDTEADRGVTVTVGPGAAKPRAATTRDRPVDIGSPSREKRETVRFESGDIVIVEAAGGQRAAVQLVVVGTRHVEYRWRYRSAANAPVTSGRDSAVEKYQVVGRDPKAVHLTALPGNDVILRIGALRAEWSAGGSHMGFIYYDPALASLRIDNGAPFEDLP